MTLYFLQLFKHLASYTLAIVKKCTCFFFIRNYSKQLCAHLWKLFLYFPIKDPQTSLFATFNVYESIGRLSWVWREYLFCLFKNFLTWTLLLIIPVLPSGLITISMVCYSIMHIHKKVTIYIKSVQTLCLLM